MSRHLLTLAGLLALLISVAMPSVEAADDVVARPLRVHIVRGLWSREYRVEEALAAHGGAIVSESWDVMGVGFGWPGNPTQGNGHVSWRPTAEVLADTDLVIIVNVNPRNLAGSQKLLADWVNDGGHILFLGGRWAFGKAQAESPLAAVTPVTFEGKGELAQTDLYHAPAGLQIVAHTRNAQTADRVGHLYWYHRMTPREGATHILSADDQPIFVTGAFGKGGTGVFAGTVMGEATPETTPFWTSEAWPVAMAEMIDDVMMMITEKPTPVDLKPLADALDVLADPLDPPTEANKKAAWSLFQAALTATDDPAALAKLAGFAATLPADLPEGQAMTLGTKLARHRVAVPPATVTALLESGQMHKTVVGLFAASGSTDAAIVARITPFLSKPEPAAKAAGGLDELGGGGMPDAGMRDAVTRERGAYLIRYAALTALSRLADPAARPAITKLQASLEAVPMKDGQDLDMLSEEQRLWQLCLFARLNGGDTDVAPTLAAAILQTRFVISRARSEGNKTDERLEKVHSQLPLNMAWETALYHELSLLPAPAAAAIAPAIAQLTDRRAGPIALALCARQPTPAVRQALAASPHAVLRRLAAAK